MSSWVLLFLGCPAEDFGVKVPESGVEALSVEDVNRDFWALTQAPDARKRYTQLEHRMQQMHLLGAFGDHYAKGGLVCGQKDGRSGRSVVVLALEGEGASGLSPQVALISLAKTYDAPAPPKHTLVFCVAPSAEAYAAQPPTPLAATEAVISLGVLDGAELSSADARLGEARRIHLDTGAQPWHGGADDRFERIDGRQLLRHIERVREAVEAF